MCSRNIYTVYRPRPIQSPTETSLLMTDMKSCTENTSMILWCCSFEPGEEKKNAKTKRVRKWRKHCEQPSSHFIKKSSLCFVGQHGTGYLTWDWTAVVCLRWRGRPRSYPGRRVSDEGHMKQLTVILPWMREEWWWAGICLNCISISWIVRRLPSAEKHFDWSLSL